MHTWLQLSVSIGVSVLVSACIPARWRLRSMAAWLLFPAFVYWAIIAVELLTRPVVDHALGTAVFGFLLTGSVVAIPWLVLCLIGFGIGFVLRRRLLGHADRPDAARSAQQKSPLASREETARESQGEPSDVSTVVTQSGRVFARAPFIAPAQATDWREAHIGFCNSGLRLMGIEVWKSEWRSLRWPPLRLPHPAHRHQIHRYDVYEIGPPERAVRFAAAELSNGVWGFYVPTPPPTDAGESADGSLRFRRHGGRQVDGRDDSSESWFVIIDIANGQVLADCQAWESSEVTARADGSLLLHLRSNGFDALFRLVPRARCFSNVGEPGPDLPLLALAGTIEQVRLLTCRSDCMPSYRRISADGSSRVDLHSVEWSNSCWVNSPRVIEIASGRVALDLWNTDWDATVSFLDGSVVRLDMIRYRRGGNASLELDLAANTYRLHCVGRDGSADHSGDLKSLADALSGLLVSSAEDQVQAGPTGASPRQDAPPSPLAAWRTAVLILVAAMIAIVLIGFIARQSDAPVRQKLDSVPVLRIP
ncbi:MAG: hypothetical protein ABIW82_01400 [Dokdonella sp.]